jgi:hypothetical protein
MFHRSLFHLQLLGNGGLLRLEEREGLLVSSVALGGGRSGCTGC